jgi:hypothetical protein
MNTSFTGVYKNKLSKNTAFMVTGYCHNEYRRGYIFGYWRAGKIII